MKFILINLQNVKRNIELEKYYIDATNSIDEVVLSRSVLRKLLQEKSGIINRVKTSIYEAKLKSMICKALDLKKQANEKWHYILSDDISKDEDVMKYVISKLERLGGTRYIPLNEMDNNISKYISDFATSKNISLHEIKALFVYKYLKNVDLNIIDRYINEYKKINIYCIEKTNNNIIDKIDKINKRAGTSIELIKYNKKAFLEYDVIYFADDLRTNHPRMRIGKNTLVIDQNDAMCDKYNSNIIFFNKIKENVTWSNKLIEQYGVLNIAAAVRKLAK